MFSCPKCVIPIGEVDSSGTLEAVCTRCRYRYHVMEGNLTGRVSRLQMLQRQTKNSRGSYRRNYELHLTLPGDRLEIIPFHIAGQEDSVKVRRGDHVQLVHTMHGSDRYEDLISVANLSTGERFHVAPPGGRSQGHAVLLALPAGVGAILAGFAFGMGLNAIVLGVAVGVALYFVVYRLMAPRETLDEGQRARLGAAQSLLSQKQELLERWARVEREIAAKSTLRTRLLGLQAKMLEVGADLYGTRLQAIASALRTIDQQLALDAQLQESYDRTIKMIEIEIESGAGMLEPSGNILEIIDAREREMEAIDAAHQDLEHQLSANEEVERLLQAG